MAMKLISVNVGRPRATSSGKRTGIYKEPSLVPVRVTADGLDGDAVLNMRHHGGVDQAVYVYSASDYAWWEKQLGRELPPGTFGDNLTFDDYASAEAGIGDRFHLGDVVLEASAPRVPCGTLEKRMAIRGFVEQFIAAERPGVYCRVIQPGLLKADTDVRVEPYSRGERVLLLDLFRAFYTPEHTEAELRRFLAAPLAERVRREHERELESLSK
jgi:MOSC domain-containing protein YiiM